MDKYASSSRVQGMHPFCAVGLKQRREFKLLSEDEADELTEETCENSDDAGLPWGRVG